MAIINLTLHNLSHFVEDGNAFKSDNSNISLSTEKGAANIILSVGDADDTKLKFDLSLVDFGFKKKMYQPTEVLAEILIRRSDQNDTTTIKRNQIETIFKYLKVSLNSDDGTIIGNDYYVHEVMPHYQKAYMYATLKIYSLDKLLTLRKTCHAHTAKKLTEILKEELKNYKAPYLEISTNGLGTSQKSITPKTANMKVLKYGSNKNDHIFPYLVQYTESFYDMLARTCNRWGEFLFYENGELNIGYDDSSSNEKNLSDCGEYIDIYYFDYGAMDKNLTISKNKSFNLEASNDDQFIGNVLEKSPEKVEGLLFSPGEKGDKVAMKTLASFFKNEKNIPTFITNWLFDELWNLAASKSTAAFENADFDSEYFSSTDTEHYKEGKEYNQFTEYETTFNDSNYRDILAKEEAAGKNAIHIDFDTSYPKLNLGNILSCDEGKFIVVEITCKKKTTMKYKLENNVIKEDPTSSFVFEVIATASENPNDPDGKYGNFYPAVIPSGHIRQAAPQIATINNAEDPSGENQVQLVFPWQYDDINDKDHKTLIGDPTPWLRFATNAAGSSAVGQHYEDDKVLVGFVDGNVERPYVLGGLTTKGSGGSDIIHTTPGSHTFKLTDDPAGLSKFLTGMFLPVWGTASDFFPQMSADVPDVKWEASKKLGGGFELTDNYGIYKISGSTDERSINVASPWGEVNISAFTGITISAPNGDISIKGKNVSIEAGNNLELISGKNVNYKLMNIKDTFKGTMAQLATDVAVLVAKKLAEKLINIVDLSIIRSVIDIVIRPVEDCLTVKSNRFLKLEAGNNECEYPYTAYKDTKQDQQKKLDEKQKKALLAGTGKFIGVGRGMVGLIESIAGIVDELDRKYKAQYNKCFEKKAKLETSLNALKRWSNVDTKVCKKSFDLLYEQDLKSILWEDKEQFQEFTEDKLQFEDANVGTSANAVVKDQLIQTLKSLANFKHPVAGGFLKNDNNSIKAKIIEERKKLRKEALEALNNLGKEIWTLQHIELLKTDVGQGYGNLSWFAFTPVPDDLKTKMVTSISRGKCPNSIYYKPVSDDNRTKLDGKINSSAFDDTNKKYLKRLVAMNLLEELGFDNAWRKEVNGTLPPKPNTSSTANTPGMILHLATWENYVKSLSGVPPFKKDKTALGDAFEDVGKDALDKIMFWKGLGENFSYSGGKNGQILIGTDDSTYYLDKDGVKKADVLEANINKLSDADNAGDGLDAKQKQTVQAFVSKIRDALLRL